MSVIQFGCPFCGAVAEVEAAMAGQETVCPACESVLLIPSPEDDLSGGDPARATVELSEAYPASPAPRQADPNFPFPEAPSVAAAPDLGEIPPQSRPARMKLWQTSSRAETAGGKPSPRPPAGPAPLAGDIASPANELSDPAGVVGGLLDEIRNDPPSLAGRPSGPRAREEIQRRRFWYNAIMLMASLLVLAVAFAALYYFTSK